MHCISSDYVSCELQRVRRKNIFPICDHSSFTSRSFFSIVILSFFIRVKSADDVHCKIICDTMFRRWILVAREKKKNIEPSFKLIKRRSICLACLWPWERFITIFNRKNQFHLRMLMAFRHLQIIFIHFTCSVSAPGNISCVRKRLRKMFLSIKIQFLRKVAK